MVICQRVGEDGNIEIFYSLAISEAFAGSDVMGMRTTATKSKDGKYWIVNGTKKWITNGRETQFSTRAFRLITAPT